jgi:hypothetical protein
MSNQNKISAKRYDDALTYMALVIEKYGDDFWPIFQKLEHEYLLIIERQNKISTRVGIHNTNVIPYSSVRYLRLDSNL